MAKVLQVVGIALLAILFLAVPLLSSQVNRMGGSGEVHPATYHYNYRYYRPVNDNKDSGSRQCYWYYTNGAYVYVCR